MIIGTIMAVFMLVVARHYTNIFNTDSYTINDCILIVVTQHEYLCIIGASMVV